ncbi:hypothetical protein Sbal625DRAFT_3230 [Shewanella baltica OS625]|uniref:Lipoprotein n=1 Tax=Shewanella baltica (strain OS195) TaxID=399599 RepID=A9KXA6_SHEB9|nr:hypothetical protein [Shewanella baltica]ABX47502.1 conserved hypothetical protein [Shewanella baltica OS195]ADT92528.1 hypothetical protein Sbal678_0328 [Shewanella baltica OS678]EHC05097.1 hypothetical protein Sbal625DRAFT_3230 [Shewanella baltica OS625]
MKTLLISASLLGLTACAATAPSQTSAIDPVVAQETVSAPVAPKVVELGGLTNDAAAERLYQALINANYLATKVAPTKVAVQFGDNQFLLEPSINSAGIDRILMNRFYAVHPQLQASQELPVVIGTLNQKLNFAKFVLLDQGAVIQIQGTVTFADRVEIEELRRFMLWTNGGLAQVAQSLPDGIDQYIRPIPLMQQMVPVKP